MLLGVGLAILGGCVCWKLLFIRMNFRKIWGGLGVGRIISAMNDIAQAFLIPEIFIYSNFNMFFSFLNVLFYAFLGFYKSMSQPSPRSLRLAEKLTILNDHGRVLLARIFQLISKKFFGAYFEEVEVEPPSTQLSTQCRR